MSTARFPEASLLAAMLDEGAPVEARRAARRLRAEGAPALAVEPDIAALARGLAGSEVSHNPALPEGLPPLFWIEAEADEAGGRQGWVVESRPEGLAARGFGLAAATDAVPEPGVPLRLRFEGAAPAGEEAEARRLRGLVAAAGLPGLLAQMGESAPLLLLPATPPPAAAARLRGLRLSVLLSPEAAPQ